MKKLLMLVATTLVIAASYAQTNVTPKPQPVKPVVKNNAILIGMNQKPMKFGTIKPMQLPPLRRNSTYVQSLRTARPTSGSAPAQQANGTSIGRSANRTP